MDGGGRWWLRRGGSDLLDLSFTDVLQLMWLYTTLRRTNVTLKRQIALKVGAEKGGGQVDE